MDPLTSPRGIDRVMLVKVSSAANSNKFYEVTLLDDDTVETRWGRVGAKSGQSKTLTGGRAFFDQVVRNKQRRGYDQVNNRRDDGPAPAHVSIQQAARHALAAGDQITDEVVTMLARTNQHQIQLSSGGLITSGSGGGMETALGPVSPVAVTRARAELRAAAAGNTYAVDRYLMLVPQIMPPTAGWASRFTDASFLSEQRDFLDQLDAAVTVSSAGAADARADFRYTMRVIDDSDDKAAELRTRIARTSNPNHPAASLRLHRVWELTDTTGLKTWNDTRATLHNVRRLWHGSRTHNVLSILHRGLYVPPSTGSTVNITGRMFGDGVYLSNQSTKSLNYSYGTWSGTRDTRCFMFDAEVVLGWELRTTTNDTARDVITRMRRPDPATGKTYNSLTVKAGTCGVINNETVIPDTKQILLRHLCEFRPR